MTQMPPLGTYTDLSNPANRPGANRPAPTELAALSTNRPGTVRASARTGSKAHLADITEAQLRVLWAADNPSGLVSTNGSTGITRPLVRNLDVKGYGRAMYDTQRRHLIIGFQINQRGRAAARERFGTPEWAVSVHEHQPPSIYGAELCGRVVVRPGGTAEQCAEPVKSPIHDPAAYLAFRAELAAELAKWSTNLAAEVAGPIGQFVVDTHVNPLTMDRVADDTHVHPFTD
jgi:hypothetical protein